MVNKKNLTLSTIKQKNKELYEEKLEIEIEGYKVSVSKVWSPTKINELIKEFSDNLRLMNSDEQLSISSAYLYLLLLRYFSSLSIPKELNKQLEWLNELIDSGYLDKLISSLPTDQLAIVELELKVATENMKRNLPIIEEELTKIEFENEEIEVISTVKTEWL